MKYKYKIENLDCANCAKEIENHLNKDPNLKNVSCNFSKSTLTIETTLTKNVKKYVSKKSKEVEPDITILELNENIDAKNNIKKDIIILIVGLFLILLSHLFNQNKIINEILSIFALIVLLSKTTIKAIKMLIKSHTINENMLISISCIGAFLIDKEMEGLMVIFLYQIGKILENLALNNSRKSISNLMDIKPDYACVLRNNEQVIVNPEEVKIGETIIVKKGEKIPLDGIIIKGNSKLDNSSLTGESKLVNVKEQDEVLSGTINIGNILEIKVTKDYENSTVAQILELVENASDKKAKTENFVSQAAKIYTPVVLILSVIVFITYPIFFDYTLKEALNIVLTYLVISCPCAIAISVPLSYFSGIGVSSKNGILIKGSDYLDNLRKLNTIIFDKTGTITTGNFEDLNLIILDNEYSKNDIINYYVKGESLSNHPIGKSIVKYFAKKTNTKDVKNFKEISGKGISYEIDSTKVKIGSAEFVKSNQVEKGIFLKVDSKIIAKIELKDKIKYNSKKVISELKKHNIKTMIFTGDKKEIAEEIAEKVNIDEVKYELLPNQKYNELLKEMEKDENLVGFVGDGINDAPSIVASNIGFSMGNIGSDSAIEASDIVIIDDDLDKIRKAINISKYTAKIIKENLIFSIGTKIIILILTSMNLATMAAAVFADTGVTVLTILNTTRILKHKIK